MLRLALAGALGLVASVGVILMLIGIFSPNTKILAASSGPKKPKSEAKSFLPNRYTPRGIITAFIQSREAQIKVGIGVVLAVVFWFGTGWPVATVFAFVIGWLLPDITGASARGRRAVATLESFATWTAQLTYLVNAGSHIGTALVASRSGAPENIRENISLLARESEIIGLIPAVDNFAERCNSAPADQVVLGLKVAYASGTKIAEVFEDLSQALTKQTEVMKKAESQRQLANNQILMSLGASFVLVVLLVLVNRGYLNPFDTAIGQVVMALSAILFSAALLIVRRFTIVGGQQRLIHDEAYLRTNKQSKQERRKRERAEKREKKDEVKEEVSADAGGEPAGNGYVANGSIAGEDVADEDYMEAEAR